MLRFCLLMLTAASASMIQVAYADSLAKCDDVKTQSGMTAYLECVANQNIKNYVPGGGPAPGMTMDQIDSSIDKTLCEGPASFCEGYQPGEKVGSCICK